MELERGSKSLCRFIVTRIIDLSLELFKNFLMLVTQGERNNRDKFRMQIFLFHFINNLNFLWAIIILPRVLAWVFQTLNTGAFFTVERTPNLPTTCGISPTSKIILTSLLSSFHALELTNSLSLSVMSEVEAAAFEEHGGVFELWEV